MKELEKKATPNLQSKYLEHLPGIYRDNEFLGRFLLIFESILDPIERTVDNIPYYFDPLMTPKSILPWLASWADLTLDPTWPEARRRELAESATELYRWRGTRRGMSEYLRIYTGKIPQITEYIPGIPLGPDARLGINTRLGSSGGGYHFTVTIEADESDSFDPKKLRTIIEAQKPSHTIYTLHIQRPKREGEDSNGN